MFRPPVDRSCVSASSTTRPCCAGSDIASLLKAAGLRPTRQRLAIGDRLFRGGHCHVCADGLHQEALEDGLSMSLATVYNTLNQFADVGLLRRIAVGASRTYFDTDVGDHQHFYVEDERRIIDIPAGALCVGKLPIPPPGYRIAHVDITIRLKRIGPSPRPSASLASDAASERGNDDRCGLVAEDGS